MLIIVYYPRRLQEPMGTTGKKKSFLLTQYTNSCLEIFLNNLIKMREKFIIIKFTLIVLFILIGGIFLYSWIFSAFINPVLLCAIIPIKIYPNTETDKALILSENKNKSGIYMWTNSKNGKCYIGSAVDLYFRLSFYYSCKTMENYLKKNKSHIYNAILKDGHSNFSLTILEYCSSEQCIEREDFYLSSLKHEYNILLKAGSSLGIKLSDKTKQKISEVKKGQPKSKGSGKASQAIEVTDVTNNTTTSYNSISEATRALNLPNFQAIANYILRNQQNPYKGRYTFKKVN